MSSSAVGAGTTATADRPRRTSRASRSRIPRGGPEERTPHRRIPPKALCPSPTALPGMGDEVLVSKIADAKVVAAGRADVPRVVRRSVGRGAMSHTGRRCVRPVAQQGDVDLAGEQRFSCAGASISPRTLTSTCGNLSRNARTSRGSTEYVADPTHPIVRCPSTPSGDAPRLLSGVVDRVEDGDGPLQICLPAAVSSTPRVVLVRS